MSRATDCNPGSATLMEPSGTSVGGPGGSGAPPVALAEESEMEAPCRGEAARGVAPASPPPAASAAPTAPPRPAPDPGRPRSDVLAERAFNVALGLSFLSWAVLRWSHADPASRAAPVQWTVVAMHACAGLLVLRRARADRQGSPAAVLAGVPCFVAGLWMMRLAPPPHLWPLAWAAVFVAAGAWTLASLLTLGRSFAIFPALRSLVTRGPFSLIRHPAYAGETVMLLAAAAAAPSLLTATLALAIFPLLVLRIRAEEQTLAAAPGYADYARRVRWRLVPGVW